MSALTPINTASPKISNTTLRDCRYVNGLNAGLVFMQYFKSPQADPFEWLTDVFVHSYQASIMEDTENRAVITALGLNVFRLSSIFYYAYASNSTIPLVLNVIDLGLHCKNIAALTSLLKERNVGIKDFFCNEKMKRMPWA